MQIRIRTTLQVLTQRQKMQFELKGGRRKMNDSVQRDIDKATFVFNEVGGNRCG